MSSDQASSDRAGKDGVASTHKTKTENEGQNFKNKESSASRTKSSKHADTVKSGSKDVEVNKSSEQNLKVDGRFVMKNLFTPIYNFFNQSNVNRNIYQMKT